MQYLLGAIRLFQFVMCGLQWQTDKKQCLTEACTENRKHKIFFWFDAVLQSMVIQIQHPVVHVTMTTGVKSIADPSFVNGLMSGVRTVQLQAH